MRSNRIVYIISIVVAMLLYCWTGFAAALAVVLFLVGSAVLLALGVLITRATVKIDIDVPASCSVGDDATIILRMRKGLPFSASLVCFDITCRSATFRIVERHSASVAMNTLRNDEVRIPLDAGHYGRTEVTVERCWCEDSLGLFRCNLPWSKSQSCIVFPSRMTLVTNVKHVPLSRAFGATYDDTRSGSDVDEVFDVREFQAGDHLASVHWKLTSKFDVMMSRQFSHPVDFELVVVSLGALKDEGGAEIAAPLLNGVASASEAISSDLMRQGLSHNFALPVKGELVGVAVDGMDALDSVSELILDAPLPDSYSDAVACLFASELAANFTKCILITPIYDESLWTQMSLEMDLSVVFLADGSQAQEIGGNYDLVVVDIGNTEDHEHCISL